MSYSPGPEVTYSGGSPNNDRSTARSDYLDAIQHTTIRQILTATHVQTRFKINDKETGFVQLVANVYDTSYTGGKMDFRLDDGTGRMKAMKWDIIDEDKECEFAESIGFQYARVIGTIAEYCGMHYLKIMKIDLVDDPHEIYHHLLKVMVEFLMLQRGPPSHAVARPAMPATPNRTTEPFSLRALENSLPSVVSHMGDHGSSVQESPMVLGTPPSHAPMRERPVTPVQRTARISTPPSQDADESPISVRVIGGDSSKKSYRIGGDPPSPEPSHEPVSPSPAARRRRPSSRPSLDPGRLLRSSTKQATTSTAEVSHFQASPQFVSPTGSLPRRTSGHHEAHDQLHEQRRVIPQPPNDSSAPQTPVQPRRSTRTSTRLRRDPYSHLSNLQREIILTIQNTMLEIGGAERGVHIKVIVDSMTRRSPGFDEICFGEAFASLVEEGYVFTTIDDNHFACTV
ncbi:hypothetical protein AGABI1DRAFT_125089 [Agaricus bisporus var. burnettii JB137-S8]|uniref:Replication protein A C-terminal domain-containing protein n=1 Tax=Agaricus bisporus var. burnettii (strain JB137-S8 / ATCC MYA-4627 / FGSC 10392) TaxID=597362 RepID=K5W732_AGABU|nr:uncharacterized protein AGABI1DRAFT_125089 [Agaricus bisporus var. burnettii JB137-S8]EKM82624.1 hypothetical protein AGABI1DRAFT_125089 [Agaricus bisporus var. burnettii JB137-S8]